MLNIDTKALLHYTRLHRREVIFVPHWAVAYITPLSDPVCATEQKSLRFVGDTKSNLVYATSREKPSLYSESDTLRVKIGFDVYVLKSYHLLYFTRFYNAFWVPYIYQLYLLFLKNAKQDC